MCVTILYLNKKVYNIEMGDSPIDRVDSSAYIEIEEQLILI